MSLLQLLKINLTLCFLFITNINSVNAQSINNSDNKCNFITGKYSDELSDLKSFQSINVKINNYKNWVENSLAILTSRLGDSYIEKKYKKKFAAKITVNYLFGTCVYNAEVRQTGDIIDHIDYKREGILQSLSIKLIDGNIANIVGFKLLIKDTRNSESEILATLLLSKLGFLAPRTRMVDANINGNKHTMLFQENPVKEFLEKNLRREGPMFEGDETFVYELLPLKLSNLSLARLENKKWVGLGNNALKMALKAYSTLQYSYMESRGDINSNHALNIDMLTKDNNNLRRNFYEFEALVLSMGGSHGLGINNRKFYWNALLNGFEPIYYDGMINSELLPISFALDNDNLFYYSKKFLPAVKNLIFRVNQLNENTFVDSALSLCNSQDCSKNKIKTFLHNVKANLLYYQNKIQDNKNSILSTGKTNYKINYIVDSYENDLFSLLPKSNLYFIDINSVGKSNILSYKCNKIDCIEVNIKAEKLISLMKNTAIDLENISIFGGLYNDNDNNTESTYIDFLDTDIKHSLGSRISYDQKNRIIKFKQSKYNDWALLSNVKINNISFEMISDYKKIINEEKIERFNEYGLTGCLNFLQVDFVDTKIKTSGGGCEDSVNIIDSTGNIEEINVDNAFSDALDIDFSDLKVKKILVTKAKNDCLDLSFGKYFVNEAFLKECGDKGVSIGETSEFQALKIIASDTNIGISSKDSSLSKIDYFSGNNVNICYESYQKKQEFFGGQLYITKDNCIFETISKDNNSIIIIEEKESN
ncbi:MAG: hypothetical protein CFH17_01302 [Alphaproteobacteria bacterium MarineAlpha5_Bin7]|nr:MAG: hypothetical protein CFH17_01302 [Alphaproteobacteria bacterium MarineAlpha5_Bin7]|tara:strand:- start:1946 stop:4234 length:2289 start_codon:yes stop_codon:yes gene_type:complete